MLITEYTEHVLFENIHHYDDMRRIRLMYALYIRAHMPSSSLRHVMYVYAFWCRSILNLCTKLSFMKALFLP